MLSAAYRRAGSSLGTLSAAGMLAGCAVVNVGSFGKLLCELVPRPQHPKNRPYIVQQRTIDGGAPGVRLAGELTIPESGGPFPGVVLVSGSAVVDRDSRILGHKFFLVLADYLTRQGYAVYRHDDRGYAGSTGNTHAATDADFAADSAAALAWLRTHSEVDVRRVGYIGHSQGGLKAPLAAQTERPYFMVLLAGGVQPNSTISLQQARDFGKIAGLTEGELREQDGHLRKILRIIVSSETPGQAREAIETLGIEDGFSRRKARKIATRHVTPRLSAALEWDGQLFGKLDQKLARMLMSFDGPVLSLYPEVDYFVRAEPNASLTRPLLTNPASRVVTLPGLNHMFQPAITGSIDEICETEITFDTDALELIGDWLDNINAS